MKIKKHKKQALIPIETDIHCHLLPGVDDGVKTVEESINILKQAIQSGVKNVVFTPHFSYRRGFNKTKDEIINNYQDFLKICISEKLPLQLYLGCEIEFSYDMLQQLYNDNLIPMASSSCLLIEFLPMTRGNDIINGLKQLSSFGYTPILAHVERYKDLISDIDNIWKIKDNNALIQMNILSLLGREKAFCKKALKLQLIDFIATDIHRQFPPENIYTNALKNLASWTSAEYYIALINDNAQIYIFNQDNNTLIPNK